MLFLNTPPITLILAIYSYDAVPTLCQPLNGVRGRQHGEQGFSDIAPACTELTSNGGVGHADAVKSSQSQDPVG